MVIPSLTGARRALGACLALFVLHGCATQSVTSVPSAPEGDVARGWGRPLSGPVAAFLAESPAGASTVVAESPWGSDITLSAGRRYYAASGRECRELRIDGSQAPDKGIACRSDAGWVYVRAVAHKGQSLGPSKE